MESLVKVKERKHHELNPDKLPAGYFRVEKTADSICGREYFTLVYLGNRVVYHAPASEYEAVNRMIAEERFHWWTNQEGELELKLLEE